MSSASYPQSRGPGTGGHHACRGLGLLDERQWSYIQRRYELTRRELEIAELVCRGFRNSRIAASLNIQPATVKTHVRNIYRKVRVKSKINMLLKFLHEEEERDGNSEHAASGDRLGP